MKAKEYGSRPAHNIQSGGKKYSYDEYNREYKKTRYKSAEEYASRNVKEYHHYPEQMDLTSDDDNQEQLAAEGGVMQLASSLRKNGNSGKRMRMLQQVICLVAGSTIIVSSYQAMTAQQAIAETPDEQSSYSQEAEQPSQEDNTIPDSEEPSADNSDSSSQEDNQNSNDNQTADNSSSEQSSDSQNSEQNDTNENQDNQDIQDDSDDSDKDDSKQDDSKTNTTVKWSWNKNSASLKVYDKNGKLVTTINAKVSEKVSKKPTCTAKGSKVLTATASYGGKSYSDKRNETTEPLGHSFDEGKETVLKNGESAMVFRCKRCDEKFTIATSYTENDD